MASAINQQTKVILPEDSVSEYGFKVPRTVTITGMELTADKIKLLMKEAANIMNINTRDPRVAVENYNKFVKLCKEQNAQVSFS
jgi:hypothetical protein